MQSITTYVLKAPLQSVSERYSSRQGPRINCNNFVYSVNKKGNAGASLVQTTHVYFQSKLIEMHHKIMTKNNSMLSNTVTSDAKYKLIAFSWCCASKDSAFELY